MKGEKDYKTFSQQLLVPLTTTATVVLGAKGNLPEPGRKKNYNPRLTRQIVWTVEKESRKPSKTIRAKLQDQATSLSDHTIHNISGILGSMEEDY